ncbi:hypothetical protein ANN_19060 [Periplaneta americana]|uniref:Uncharacterized protein n=1 Tax=Periplaneta americana TaxID=6978 RepID=A0ABQ8SRV9_PERAM|nr:hypothetical protein ANN_19060 [Periplaneta americana]
MGKEHGHYDEMKRNELKHLKCGCGEERPPTSIHLVRRETTEIARQDTGPWDRTSIGKRENSKQDTRSLGSDPHRKTRKIRNGISGSWDRTPRENTKAQKQDIRSLEPDPTGKDENSNRKPGLCDETSTRKNEN